MQFRSFDSVLMSLRNSIRCASQFNSIRFGSMRNSCGGGRLAAAQLAAHAFCESNGLELN